MSSSKPSNSWNREFSPPRDEQNNKTKATKKRFLPRDEGVIEKRVSTIDNEKLAELRGMLGQAMGSMESAANLAANGLSINSESSVLDIALRERLNELKVAGLSNGVPLSKLSFKERHRARTEALSQTNEAQGSSTDSPRVEEKPAPAPLADQPVLDQILETMQELLKATQASTSQASVERKPSAYQNIPGCLEAKLPVAYRWSHLLESLSKSTITQLKHNAAHNPGSQNFGIIQVPQLENLNSFATEGTSQQPINVFNIFEMKPLSMSKPHPEEEKSTEMVKLELSKLCTREKEALENFYRNFARMFPMRSNDKKFPRMRKCEVCSRDAPHHPTECTKLSDPVTQAQKFLDNGSCLVCLQKNSNCKLAQHYPCGICKDVSTHLAKYIPTESRDHHPTLCWVIFLAREANKNLKNWSLLECVRLPIKTWRAAKEDRRALTNQREQRTRNRE